MPSEILGAPTHALLIHVVVVLVPLSAVGGLAMCFVPFVARRYSGLVAAGALACIPATALAASAGGTLERQVRQQPLSAAEAQLMERHTQLGDSLLPFVIVLAVGALLFAVTRGLVQLRVAAQDSTSGSGSLPDRVVDRAVRLTRNISTANLVRARWVGVVLSVGGALLSLYFVVLIGHLGAQAAWTRVASGAS